MNTYRPPAAPPSSSVRLSCFLKEKHTILLLYDNGFGKLLLEGTDRLMEDLLGDMPYNAIEWYYLYVLSGAVFNVMIQWLKTGARETPREMAQVMMRVIEQLQQMQETLEEQETRLPIR